MPARRRARTFGTTDNQALQLHVNGARALRLEPNATSPNLIGGYSGNSVTAGAVGAAIGGSFVLLGTAGQPDAGPALGDAGGRFTLLGGFWPAAVGEEGNPAVYLPLVVSNY